MNYKLYILILIVLLALSTGYAQKYFSITLLEDLTNQPIPDALIEIDLGPNNSVMSQKTDQKGKVSFNISSSQINDYTNYTLRIVADGYFGPVTGVIVLKHPLDRIHKIKKMPEIQRPEKAAEENSETNNELASSPTNNTENNEIKNNVPNKLRADAADNNFVFLIDVSASMNHPNRMPVLKESLKYITGLYRDTDFVTLITYSSKAEIVLESTSAKHMDSIHIVIDSLKTLGKTMGGVGLDLAYETALNNFIDKGNNKVIIATDGAFTNDKKEDKLMFSLVQQGLNNKIRLTSLAFGNIDKKDLKRLRLMSQRGEGRFYHIDSLEDAKDSLLKEATSEKRATE